MLMRPIDTSPHFHGCRTGLRMTGPGDVSGTAARIEMLVNALSMQTHQIVLDRTGLNGVYDFNLHWTPDPGEAHMEGPGPGPGAPGGGGPAPSPDSAQADSSGPSLFTAIHEQLGLKLESQKAPVDVLVIAHVEKPSEN